MGTQIGSYLIERQLGQGGFGVVYVGMDVRLHRRAAIKQLLPELSGQREIVERFFNEAKAAAGINHPGIVEIYDVGWHTDGSAYFAMKLLDGDSLAKRMRGTGAMPVALAATIARQVSSALVAAHARGIVHRDLKPDNIILVPDDEVAIGERAVVLDFGIAKLGGEHSLAHKTRTGMMMGTPLYMSPEQCRGAGEVDHRTDVYALGCIVFEMLGGRPPFVGEGAGEILGMHQFVEPPALRSLRADVPAELEAIVMRALAKKPEQRMQQMSELTAALQPFGAGGRSAQRSAQMPSASASIPQAAPTPPGLLHAAQHVTADAPVAVPSTLGSARGEVTAPASRKSKLPLVIGAGVVAAIAVVVIVAMSASAGEPKQAAAPPADAAVTVVQVTADAAVAAPDAAQATVPVADAAVDVAQLVARAKQLVADRKWEDAIAAAAELAMHAPANPDAKEIGRKAYAETKNEAADQELVAAIAKADAAAVKAAYAKIASDSIYKPEARAAHDKFAATYVANAKRRAQQLAAQHECSELEAFGQQAARVFPAAGEAVDEVDCSAAPPPTPVASGDVTALIEDANQAARNGQYGKALRVAEEALKQDAGNQQALTVAAIGACNLKDPGKAKKYIARLGGQRQGMARQICLRNNVTID